MIKNLLPMFMGLMALGCVVAPVKVKFGPGIDQTAETQSIFAEPFIVLLENNMLNYYQPDAAGGVSIIKTRELSDLPFKPSRLLDYRLTPRGDRILLAKPILDTEGRITPFCRAWLLGEGLKPRQIFSFCISGSISPAGDLFAIQQEQQEEPEPVSASWARCVGSSTTYLVDEDGKTVSVLPSADRVNWFPQGDKFAFVRIFNPEPSTPPPLKYENTIFFNGAYPSICIYDIKAQTERPLSPDPWDLGLGPRVSPSGGEIYFNDWNHNYWAYREDRPANERLKAITYDPSCSDALPDRWWGRQAEWSADGKWFVLEIESPKEGRGPNLQVFAFRVKGFGEVCAKRLSEGKLVGLFGSRVWIRRSEKAGDFFLQDLDDPLK